MQKSEPRIHNRKEFHYINVNITAHIKQLQSSHKFRLKKLQHSRIKNKHYN